MLRLMEGDLHEQTPLYAGKPEYPAVLVDVASFIEDADMSSDNPTGADNQ